MVPLSARIVTGCFPCVDGSRTYVEHIPLWWKPWKWCCVNCLWVWATRRR